MVSGKGGVGKTLTSLNIAKYLSSFGYQTALLNVDSCLNDIKTLIWQSNLEAIPQLRVINYEPSIDVGYLQDLATKFDFIVVDCPSRISGDVGSILKSTDFLSIVIDNQPHTISDTLGFLKSYKKDIEKSELCLVVNKSQNSFESERISQRFSIYLKDKYGFSIETKYVVPFDQKIIQKIFQGNFLNNSHDSSGSCMAWRSLANYLCISISNHHRSGVYERLS